MPDIDLKTETPDTSLPTTGFLFGADSQAASSPSVYTTQSVATTLLGSTTLSGTTITANAPVLNLSQTWNNAAVTFTGLQFNATDTASNSASLLLDLQIGGSSRFRVSKEGAIFIPSGQTIGNGPNLLAIGGGNIYAPNVALTIGTATVPFGSLFVSSSSQLCWAASGTADLFLTRKDTRNLRLGAVDAATALAQTFSVQSVVAGTTNGAGANFTITGSQGTGSGAGGSIIFQVAPANGGGGATVQNPLVNALTIDTTNIISNRGGSSSIRSDGEGFYAITGVSTKINVSQYGLRLTSDLALAWANNTTNCNSGQDTILVRDGAPNTLALRNGTAGQTFNVYDSYTDASNYRRASLSNGGGAGVILSLNGAGSGNNGSLYLRASVPPGTIEFGTASTDRWRMDASGHFLAIADNTYDIGAFNGSRPRYGYFAAGVAVYGSNVGVIMQQSGDGILRLLNYANNDFNRIQFGGTTSSFPALKRSTTFLQARLADDSAACGFSAANIQAETAYTVATLPTPATGMMARVTDATAPVVGSTVTGGGAAYALVNYNGANWTVIGV